MTTEEAVLWAAVVFFIVAGVWLAGLTYLMWRAHRLEAKTSEARKPTEETSTPEELEST